MNPFGILIGNKQDTEIGTNSKKQTMKKIALIPVFLFCITMNSYSQDRAMIERAALDYIEGFYEGDTLKIIRSLHPDLSKYGYSKDDKNNSYRGHPMSFEKAVDYARDVFNNPKWAAPKGAVKKIEILDVQDKIANAKLTLFWGIDYLLLVKHNDKWMITKVLWQALD